MSDCKLDHTQEDVQKKLHDQAEYLDKAAYAELVHYLQAPLPQTRLNELFHLLKKYDLADLEERKKRDAALHNMLMERMG